MYFFIAVLFLQLNSKPDNGWERLKYLYMLKFCAFFNVKNHDSCLIYADSISGTSISLGILCFTEYLIEFDINNISADITKRTKSRLWYIRKLQF